MIDKLQFISNQTTELTHLDSIRIALEAGCRWIQLRIKNEPEDVVLKTAILAKGMCDTYQARLIVNDFPFIAREIGAYGLHLGLNDMPISEARKIAGPEMIIGGTANTLQNILDRIMEGADYVGLGPFRFTSTKTNLSPVLGLEGYKSLTESLNNLKHIIPLIAIGGITQDDVPEILRTGMYGVAISGSIIAAANPKKVVYQINKVLC